MKFDVKLVASHIHEGVKYVEGEVIAVEEHVKEWLIKNKVGELLGKTKADAKVAPEAAPAPTNGEVTK